MLRRAVVHVVSDSSFQFPVEPAATALQQAKSVLEWVSLQENAVELLRFEESLLGELKSTVPSCVSDSRSFVTARSDMYGATQCTHFSIICSPVEFLHSEGNWTCTTRAYILPRSH